MAENEQFYGAVVEHPDTMSTESRVTSRRLNTFQGTVSMGIQWTHCSNKLCSRIDVDHHNKLVVEI